MTAAPAAVARFVTLVALPNIGEGHRSFRPQWSVEHICSTCGTIVPTAALVEHARGHAGEG